MLMVLSDVLLKIGDLFYRKIQLGSTILCLMTYVLYSVRWNDVDLIHYLLPEINVSDNTQFEGRG